MDIKEALKKAKTIVLDPDIGLPESLQSTALSEVFRLLTRDTVSAVPAVPKVSATIPVSQANKSPVDESPNFYINLASKLGVEDKQIEELFHFSEDQLNLLLHPVPGAAEREQEQNAARLVLFGYKIGLKQQWVSASILRKTLKNLGLGRTNFSTNIRALKSEIIPVEQGGESGYELTLPGEMSAIKILQEYLEGKDAKSKSGDNKEN